MCFNIVTRLTKHLVTVFLYKQALTEAGFLITRPQHLIDNMVDAALAAAKADR